MTDVVTRLVVRGDGSLAVLDQFENKMEAAGKATDRSTGAVASFEARMAKASAAMAAGNAISTETVARRSAEQRAFDGLAATVDKGYALHIRQAKEAERAAASAANAVNMGYVSNQEALIVLMGLERQHMAQMQQADEIARARVAEGLAASSADGQAAWNSYAGVGAGSGKSAREVAAVFEAELSRLDDIARMRADQLGAAFGAELNSRLVTGTGKSARDAAAVFQAEMDRVDDIARMRAEQIGATFGAELSSRLIAGTGKSARDAAAVFQAEMDRLDDIARMAAQEAGLAFNQDFNARMGIGLTPAAARDSAAVFEEAARGADEYARKVAAVKAQVDPASAAQDRYNAEMAEFSAMLRAGDISLSEFSQAQLLAAGRMELFIRSAQAAGSAVAGVSRQATANARNLSFQLIDIGQSIPLAFQSPLYFLQNLGFQLAQISQIYLGNGGMKQALADIVGQVMGFARYLGPVAVAVGAFAAAVGGLTYEINKTAEVQVGFFDVALAGWQLFAEGIGSAVSPVWNLLVSGLQWVWDQMVPILKAVGNGLIAPFAYGVKAIGSLWQGLPAALGDIMITTANVIVKGVEWSINEAAKLLDGFIDKANEGLALMPGGLSIPNVGRVDFGGASNPYAGSLGKLGTDLGANNTEAFTTDYMGNMFDAISGRAQALAGAKDALDGVGGAASAANDNVKKLADDGMSSLADKAFDVAEGLRSALQGIGSGIFDAFKKGGDVAGGVLDMLMGKLEQFASSWLDNIVNNGINSLFSMFGSGGFSYGAGVTADPWAGMRIGQNANGTDNWRGGLSWVGERGPELVNLPRGAQVFDHNRSAGMAANNNRPINVQTNIINNAGVEVVERSVDDGQGGVRQEIVLNRAVANAIGKPGPAQKAVRSAGQLVRR